MKTKSNPVGFYPPYRVFRCECDEDKEMSFKEMVAHAEEKHGVSLKGAKMNKNLMLHINKKPRHSTTYQWEAPGFNFYEYIG